MFRASGSTRQPLTPLEQLIMDYVWAHPGCTAEVRREGLRNLEEKGYINHTVDSRTFVYRSVDTKRSVAVEAAVNLIERFCGGSVEELLVGLVDNQVLKPQQLQRLAAEIAERKGKTA